MCVLLGIYIYNNNGNWKLKMILFACQKTIAKRVFKRTFSVSSFIIVMKYSIWYKHTHRERVQTHPMCSLHPYTMLSIMCSLHRTSAFYWSIPYFAMINLIVYVRIENETANIYNSQRKRSAASGNFFASFWARASGKVFAILYLFNLLMNFIHPKNFENEQHIVWCTQIY